VTGKATKKSRVCCLRRLGQRNWFHVSQMKGSFCCTLPLSALCSILLAQLHKDFWLVLHTKPGYNHNFH